MPEPTPKLQAPEPAPSYSARRILIRTALATAVLAGVVAAGVAGFGQKGPFVPFGDAHGDHVTDTQGRIRAFEQLAPLALVALPPQEVPAALAQMGLQPAARAQLEQALALSASSSPPQAGQPTVAAPQPAQQAIAPAVAPAPPAAATVAPKPDARPSQKPPVQTAPPSSSREAPTATTQAPPLMLVRITLWDTDAQDRDEVRIESQGYSRIVQLTKAEQVVVAPVSASGVINIVGMRDGEGGGITVGVASGSSRAVFPVMSEGQVLGLKVAVPQ